MSNHPPILCGNFTAAAIGVSLGISTRSAAARFEQSFKATTWSPALYKVHLSRREQVTALYRALPKDARKKAAPVLAKLLNQARFFCGEATPFRLKKTTAARAREILGELGERPHKGLVLALLAISPRQDLSARGVADALAKAQKLRAANWGRFLDAVFRSQLGHDSPQAFLSMMDDGKKKAGRSLHQHWSKLTVLGQGINARYCDMPGGYQTLALCYLAQGEPEDLEKLACALFDGKAYEALPSLHNHDARMQAFLEKEMRTRAEALAQAASAAARM